MGVRLFTDDTSWEHARKDVRYTAKSLGTRQKHEQLVKPLAALVARWSVIDDERRQAEDALVDANAVVAARDDELDEAIFRLVSRLLAEVENDASHPTFQAYFPEPPSEVIHLGLESEIIRTKELFQVAEQECASAAVRQILAAIAELHRSGEEALREREQAFVALSRADLHIQDWKESANAARRSITNVLEAFALKNNLPRGYAEGFFTTWARTEKKTAKASEPG